MSDKRHITAEDLNRIRVVTEVRISPAGGRIVYTVQEANTAEDKYRVNLYEVPTDGGESRPLTHGDQKNTDPVFSPDGKLLAFVSDRSGKSQIWILPVDGGEARKVTDQPDGSIRGLAFSPDSGRLAFVFGKKDVDEKDARTEEEKKKIQRAKNAPRVIRRMRYKEEGTGFLPKERDHVWVSSVRDSETTQITRGPYDNDAPVWSRDGKSITFASNRSEDPDFDLNRVDFWEVSASGGEPARIPTPEGWCQFPQYSPDGGRVAYLGNDYPEDTWGWRNLQVWTTAEGSAKCLTGDHDRSYGNLTIGDMRGAFDGGPGPRWSSDGRWIYAAYSDWGCTHLAAVPGEGGEPKVLVGGDLDIISFDISSDGKRAALLISEPIGPGDVFACTLDGDRAGPLERLTRVNDALFSEVEPITPEPFRFESSAGIELQGWVMKPPGFSPKEKHPLILQIHGGPHGQYGNVFFHEFQLLAAQGYVVFYMNPRGSQGYGEDFAGAINADWGNKDYDDIMDALDALLREGYVDEARMGVAGGSYGGYMTNWIIGHTDRFKAAVTMRSVTNLESMFGSSDFGFELRREFGGPPWENREGYRRMSPINYVDKMNTPLLIIHSEEDHRCPVEQAEQLYAALRSMKKDVLFVRYPGEGHGLSRGGSPEHRVHRLGQVLTWFKEHL